MTHTPGEWTYQQVGAFYVVSAPTLSVVARDIQDKDDAALLAGASELLAALNDTRNALALVDDFPTATHGLHPDIQNRALDKADAAITKATGESNG